jgi:hypothetical protein
MTIQSSLSFLGSSPVRVKTNFDFRSAPSAQPPYSGLTETNVLPAVGVSHVPVASKLNRKYAWVLSLKAAALEGTEKRYRIHIEGQQPYD